MLYILRTILLVLGVLGISGLSSCTPRPISTPVLSIGQSEPIYPPYCWVQPSGSDLWYPCGSEAVKDKECLNLMELAMKAVEADIKDGNTPKDSTVKLWNRAKQTCWSDLKDLQEKHYH